MSLAEKTTRVAPQNKDLFYVKLAISNTDAPAIIGQNGSNIISLQKDTGCTMKLTGPNVYFPGTIDRVLLLSGCSISKIVNGVMCIVDKCQHKGNDYVGNSNVEGLACRMIFPDKVVSLIIGRGGVNIKNIQEKTGAKVSAGPRNDMIVERYVTVIGDYEQVLSSVNCLLELVSEENLISSYLSMNYNQNSLALSKELSMIGLLSLQNFGIASSKFSDSSRSVLSMENVMNSQTEVYMLVTDAAAGAIIGKKGSVIANIMAATGSNITISRETTNSTDLRCRKVKITGKLRAVCSAQILIQHKIASSRNVACA